VNILFPFLKPIAVPFTRSRHHAVCSLRQYLAPSVYAFSKTSQAWAGVASKIWTIVCGTWHTGCVQPTYCTFAAALVIGPKSIAIVGAVTRSAPSP